MQLLIYSTAGFSFLTCVVLVQAFVTAPEGVEDEGGFHFGDAVQSGASVARPFPLTARDVLFFQ